MSPASSAATVPSTLPSASSIGASIAGYALIGAFTHDAPGGPSPGAAARGISVYDTTSVPWLALQVAATPNPSFMTLHPDGHLLYAVNEITHHAGQSCGAIQVYQVERDPPHLRWVAERALAPGATGPTHIAIDAEGRHLVVSAYTGGQFNLFELDAQGIPGEVRDVLAHQGLAHQGLAHRGPAHSGLVHHELAHTGLTDLGQPHPGPCATRSTARRPDPDRQEAPHAHQALCSPDGALWICCDLGEDAISLFRLQDGKFVVKETLRTPPGSGPRHAAFHPSRPWVYVINELAVSVTGFIYDETGLAPLPVPGRANAAGAPESSVETSLRPDGVHDKCGASALVMHPGGKWLYASTKGVDSADHRADSVSAWSIDPETGALSLLWRHTHDVQGARAMTLSEDGSSLYVLSQTAGTVVRLDIDPRTGAQRAAGIVARAPTPTCLTFSRHPHRPVA